MAKPVPQPTPTEQPFYDACARGELALQLCQDCGHRLFYPRTHCDQCHSHDLIWQTASGAGRIASYTVVRRGVSVDFEAPYVIALIDLDEGYRMMSRVEGIDPLDVKVGMRVKVRMVPGTENEPIYPVFDLAEDI